VTTLFGLPPKLNCEKKDVLQVAEQIQMTCMKYPWLDLKHLRSLSELDIAATNIDFFSSTIPSALQSITKLQWIEMPDGSYRLSFPKREYIQIERGRLGDYLVFTQYILPDSKPPKYKVALLAQRDDLRAAITTAEDCIQRRSCWKESLVLLNSKSRWRDLPASEKQLALLRRMKVPYPDEITKGQAAMILTMKFARKGGRGQ
jgi:hypothetical protein